FGYRAKQATSILLFGRQVELKPRAIDRSGRLIAMVYVEGTDAGLQLLKAGMAWPHFRDLDAATADLQYHYLAAGGLVRFRSAKSFHIGSLTVTVVPSPDLLSTKILPSCRSTQRFTITSPRPVPGRSPTL